MLKMAEQQDIVKTMFLLVNKPTLPHTANANQLHVDTLKKNPELRYFVKN